MSYNQYQQNPYTQGSAAEQGYGQQPYGGQAQEQHEMQPYGQQAPAGPSTLSQTEFLNKVSYVRTEIRQLTVDVNSIEQAHQRALGGNTDSYAQTELENLVSETQLRNTRIRDSIRQLKTDAERTHDSTQAIKTRQFDTLNNDFKKELQRYMEKEKEYKDRYREQVARQYRIVNPEASDDEVRAVADGDPNSEGIFQQAVSISPNSTPETRLVNLTFSPLLTAPHQPYRTSNRRLRRRAGPPERDAED